MSNIQPVIIAVAVVYFLALFLLLVVASFLHSSKFPLIRESKHNDVSINEVPIEIVNYLPYPISIRVDDAQANTDSISVDASSKRWVPKKYPLADSYPVYDGDGIQVGFAEYDLKSDHDEHLLKIIVSKYSVHRSSGRSRRIGWRYIFRVMQKRLFFALTNIKALSALPAS